MEFTFETIYNQKALTTMARALRKTVRKKKSRRSHICGWIVMVLSLLLTVSGFRDGIEISMKNIVTWLAMLCILAVLIWEDAINGYIAGKRMLKGTEKSVAVFQEEGYYSVTEIGKTEWYYDKILLFAETPGYFVFIFSPSHAQVYDKAGMTSGTAEEFREFMESKTGKYVHKI